MKPVFYVIAIVAIFFFIHDYAMKFRPIVFPFKRRKCDRFGCGNFGASRAGGRLHKGLDIHATPGQLVFAAIGGKVRLFKANSGFQGLDGIEVSGKVYKVKTMYVLPTVQQGDTVKAGQIIGTAQNLDVRYPGMTVAGAGHVHVEVWLGGVARNPTTFFPPDTPALV